MGRLGKLLFVSPVFLFGLFCFGHGVALGLGPFGDGTLAGALLNYYSVAGLVCQAGAVVWAAWWLREK